MDGPARRPAFGNPVPAEAPASGAAADPLADLRNGARPATRLPEPVGDTWNPISDDALRAARGVGKGGGSQPIPSSKSFMWGHPSGRNLFVAYLLWFLLGQISMHRFYCGQTGSAWQQMGLFVGSLIVALVFPPLGAIGLLLWLLWILADVFLIPGMLSRFKAEHASGYLDFL